MQFLIRYVCIYATNIDVLLFSLFSYKRHYNFLLLFNWGQ